MTWFRLTNFAERDMEDIGRYTEKQWDREQRNRYLTELDASFQLLANTPGIGQDCSYIRAGYRKYQVKRHVIFYHIISEDMIEIVRVLHERMDFGRHLSDDDG